MPDRRVVTIVERPDLIPIVAHWRWREFGQEDTRTLRQTSDDVAASTSMLGPPQCFVLLVDAVPVGTASLTAEDLDERPDLTPWLASVYVVPEARRRGYVAAVIEAVEAAGRSASIPTLWVYTNTAERVYARAGWRSVETIERRDKLPVVLMRRDLIPHQVMAGPQAVR